MHVYADGSGDQLTAQIIGEGHNPVIYVTISTRCCEDHHTLITNAIELTEAAARELAAALLHRANQLDPAGALYLTRVTPEQAARTALDAAAQLGSQLIEDAALSAHDPAATDKLIEDLRGAVAGYQAKHPDTAGTWPPPVGEPARTEAQDFAAHLAAERTGREL